MNTKQTYIVKVKTKGEVVATHRQTAHTAMLAIMEVQKLYQPIPEVVTREVKGKSVRIVLSFGGYSFEAQTKLHHNTSRNFVISKNWGVQ
jgi:hypothetical protein